MKSQLLTAGFALAMLTGGTPAHADAQADRAAALFAPFDKTDGPGCVVSATRAGNVVFQRAFGQAAVETGTPNTTATAFHIASLSKQFTAFAILLLEADGRLSLQDDVRRFVPELHDYPQIITLDHLLHHTSGLRDEWMMMLQGRMPEDGVSQSDILRTLYAQRELNFVPGSRYAYANSDYTLLALVVERASGQSFNDFLTQRVFSPLGMSRTWVQDNWRHIRPGLAQLYGPGPRGLERRVFSWSGYGAGNVRTSSEDMARWMLNLEAPKVGTPDLIARMAEGVRDSESVPAIYGRGLEVGRYRGARTLEHGVIAPGAAAYMLVMPDQDFGVSVMCNTETNDTRRLAHEMADLYVGDALPGEVARTPPVVSDAQLRRYAGVYREIGGALFDVSVRDGALVLQGEDVLTTVSDNRFRLTTFPVSFSFPGPADGRPAQVLHVHDPDQDRVAVRIEKTDVEDLSPQLMAGYAGRYYSPELSAVLTVEQRGNQLWLTGSAFETQVLQPPQMFRQPDAFFTQSTIGGVEFRRGGDGEVAELAITNPRVVALRFLRLKNLPQL
jgi:CubicO group peptidase (beta-lactamase class C family)